jgi:hypothetical protein
MSQALQKPNSARRFAYFQEEVISEHPEIVREVTDEEGYVSEVLVREPIVTVTQTNCRVFRPDSGRPVVRLFGTQGLNPDNGPIGHSKGKPNIWDNWASKGTYQGPE